LQIFERVKLIIPNYGI